MTINHTVSANMVYASEVNITEELQVHFGQMLQCAHIQPFLPVS